jgi:hypothetical protein
MDRARDAARGALAGLVGTVAIQGAMQGGQKLAPGATPPVRKDPGEFAVETAERATGVEALPEPVERAAATATHFGYGAAMGAVYGLARAALLGAKGAPRERDEVSDLLIGGSALGLAVWAVGYLGWLPALGLMPPVTRQRPAQVVAPVATHVLYGIVTAAAYQGMRRLTGRA